MDKTIAHLYALKEDYNVLIKYKKWLEDVTGCEIRIWEAPK